MIAAEIHQINRELRTAEFGHGLATSAARGYWGIGVGQHDERGELSRSGRDGRPESDALGTERQSEAPILDVGSGENRSLSRQDRGAHRKATVRRIAVRSRQARSLEKAFQVHKPTILSRVAIPIQRHPSSGSAPR